VFAQYVWCCIREALGLKGFLVSVQDQLSRWRSRKLGSSKCSCLTLFAGIAWALWKNRNNPDAVIHMISNFLQMWADLLKETARAKMREMAQYFSEWMKTKAWYMGPYTYIVVL
jgi:hypothetical protein